jgi:hypothetical protein
MDVVTVLKPADPCRLEPKSGDTARFLIGEGYGLQSWQVAAVSGTSNYHLEG